jgi:hypothetical protein
MAAAVGITQLLCAWGPLAFIAWIYSEAWVWAIPNTPVWDRVLAITRWGSETPVSPWTWDPAGMFSGDEFWIREMQPGLVPGTWYLHDRQSFFVFTQPLLMALGGAGITAGVLATIVASIAEWRRRRPVMLCLFLIALCFAGISVSGTIRDEAALRQRDRESGLMKAPLFEEPAFAAGRFIKSVCAAASRGAAELPPGTSTAFASAVSVAGGNKLERAAFLGWLDEQRRQAVIHRPSIENEQSWLTYLNGIGDMGWALSWESYRGPSETPATGVFNKVSCGGKIWPARPEGWISAWEQTSTPLYSADERRLSADEASAWLETFLQLISAGDAALEDFFLPTLLALDPSDVHRHAPASRDLTVQALLASRAGWSQFTLASATPGLRPLPGARWELTCEIHQSGTRRDGHRAGHKALHWQIEVVFTSRRWQILRLRL